jgi:hypothetical protein
LLGDATDVDVEAMLLNDPVSLQEALTRPDAAKWQEAAIEEWHALLENETFQIFMEECIPVVDLASLGIVDLNQFTPLKIPTDAHPIDSKWVLRVKRNPNGTIRYKVRLVIQGFQQIKDKDYDETYAPVSTLTTFRMMMACAARFDWQVDDMDVVTAFLNPEIDKDNVYMVLPKELEWINQRLAETTTVRLKKALYGLKQAQSVTGMLGQGKTKKRMEASENW